MRHKNTFVRAFGMMAIVYWSSAGCTSEAPSEAPIDEVPKNVCGDKTLAKAEACDDGNALSGDGCADDCTVESGFTCDGAPSVCTDIDECMGGAASCSADATCANTAGSFTCTCASGFMGDGVTCTDIDECMGGAASCSADATCANTAGSFTCTCDSGFMGDGLTCTPMKTCADALTQTPGAPDGEYMLFLDGDMNKPMAIYCADMATTPAEYLTLPSQMDANFSQYTAGDGSPGTNVRTVYQRVRINLAELQIITSDQKYSMSQGTLEHGQMPVTSMPYAVAMSCDSMPSGVGNVDLTGTPFAVAKAAFSSNDQGTAMYSMKDQIVDLTGGGFCGWTGPIGSFDPFNTNGLPLPLVYIGP